MFLCHFRFVKLVRSKTPKVTLYTQRAKCMLMENGPNADFEAVFYDGKCVIGQETNPMCLTSGNRPQDL